MKVFLAGATGAIGQQLVPLLVAAGHDVHGMTRSEAKQGLLSELGAVPVVADALDRDLESPGQRRLSSAAMASRGRCSVPRRRSSIARLGLDLGLAHRLLADVEGDSPHFWTADTCHDTADPPRLPETGAAGALDALQRICNRTSRSGSRRAHSVGRGASARTLG